MRVKDLIKELQKHDPKMLVLVKNDELNVIGIYEANIVDKDGNIIGQEDMLYFSHNESAVPYPYSDSPFPAGVVNHIGKPLQDVPLYRRIE